MSISFPFLSDSNKVSFDFAAGTRKITFGMTILDSLHLENPVLSEDVMILKELNRIPLDVTIEEIPNGDVLKISASGNITVGPIDIDADGVNWILPLANSKEHKIFKFMDGELVGLIDNSEIGSYYYTKYVNPEITIVQTE